MQVQSLVARASSMQNTTLFILSTISLTTRPKSQNEEKLHQNNDIFALVF